MTENIYDTMREKVKTMTDVELVEFYRKTDKSFSNMPGGDYLVHVAQMTLLRNELNRRDIRNEHL